MKWNKLILLFSLHGFILLRLALLVKLVCMYAYKRNAIWESARLLRVQNNKDEVFGWNM